MKKKEKCKFCKKKHIDWEKECKYWGRPPLKIIGNFSQPKQ